MKQRMEQFPYPNCTYMSLAITNAHCETEHNMTKHDLFEEYGKPNVKTEINERLVKNKKIGRFEGTTAVQSNPAAGKHRQWRGK